MTRIELADTVKDAALKMCEGNPGALRVVMELMSGVPGFLLVCHLDSLNIYGSRIWILYKDCCGMNIETVGLVLRAWQLGELDGPSILEHIATSTPFEDLPTEEEMLKSMYKRHRREAE